MLVSSSCSSWTLRLFGVEAPCNPHPSLCPNCPHCPSSCQERQESPPLENASVDRSPCSAGQRCRYGCLPSAGAGNRRSLEGPGGWIQENNKGFHKYLVELLNKFMWRYNRTKGTLLVNKFCIYKKDSFFSLYLLKSYRIYYPNRIQLINGLSQTDYWTISHELLTLASSVFIYGDNAYSEQHTIYS